MKKSLFKRVFATATAVPLALTQCLSVANAINVTDATVVLAGANLTNEKSVSVDSLAFIEPTAGISESDGYTWVGEKDADGMPVGEGYFEKNSEWNVTVSSAISAAAKEGTIDTAPIFEGIVNKAGQYSDIAKSVTEKVGDVKYTISSKNIITVSAHMEDIIPIFEDFADKKVGSSLKDLAEKYDMPELANIKFFEGLNIEGDIVITIDASTLNADTLVNGEISFTDKAGKTYKGMALADYARDQVEAIRDAVVSKIESLVSEYELTSEEIEQMVQDSDEYNNMITDLETGYKPEGDELQAMVLESAEFKKLVTDYMEEHSGISYEEAEAKIKDSDDYQEMMDRFSNGFASLSDEEIVDILQQSDDYKKLVAAQEEAGATPDEAVAAVLESDEYKKLLEDYTDKYTYTREEIEEIVKGSDSYKNKLAEINAEYEEQYAEMTSKANAAKEQIENLAGPVLAKYEVAKAKYDTVKSFEKTIEAKNYADLANKVNNDATFKKYLSAAKNKIPSSLDKYASKIPDSIPTSLSSVASKSAVQKIFSQIVNQVAETSGIQIEGKPADIAAFVESFSEITASFEGGALTYTGKLTDEDETGGVNAKSYIEDTYEVEVSDFYKEATIVVDYATLDSAGNVSVDFQLKRIVEAKAKEKDTTTTTTTTSTSTSTSTTTTDPSGTTTTTDPSGTTTTTDPSGTTTTTDPSGTT
ncbi:MAG: hypothetical protein K2K91_03155, partial [Ruminococcus sp.]|nr:hypothetical protein [Ruminococcus sp.]